MTTMRNPKDSMKSTWRTGDKEQWKIPHKILDHANVYHVDLDREVPVHSKEEKIPYVSDWALNRWVIVHAGIPLLIHQLYNWITGGHFHPIVAFFYYYYASRLFTTRELRSLRELGHKYGFLDGDKHERDGVPDVGVSKTLTSVLLAGFVRPLMTTYLTYNANEAPFSLDWKWIAVEVSLYGIILDFWFYWYHRIMHDVNGMPMGFYEWHVCQLYVMFAELAGHSGLRLHASPPNPLTWLMRMFDAEMVIEDHDLHHRQGWKKSHNYGKQTRVWDRIFGTCSSRIESVEVNIDYDNTVSMSIF
ncbi:uncharacterized protein N7446_006191 [Penicillium canescens]|uniref:uncharacterized protein n=1 Tax=Penicillium canescens TaxID=5083 RepID=UPI0026DF3E9B|nr:uncharacterized protein N7446_006191 [Penicillium canescens]KAJ6062071.1 hypothetical protein N7446_006191 [Penicillium canescens]